MAITDPDEQQSFEPIELPVGKRKPVKRQAPVKPAASAPEARIREAQSPYHVHPKAIPVVVYIAVICLAVGYLALLWQFLNGQLTDGASLSLFWLHTVGLFAVLLAFFGKNFKVSGDSAGSS
jgi:hypothetical protein